jgi:2',3'-cyclic-nucleotide 2'-phosphodiesterase (5'-nucleotidase family)
MVKGVEIVIAKKTTLQVVLISMLIAFSSIVTGQEQSTHQNSEVSEGGAKRATIIFSADLPLINDYASGDYAQLATLLKQHRTQSKNTFFLFGGRSIGPSPMAVFDRGSHIIDILNSLEPDAYSVANREFSYFEDELSLRSFEAAFPLVASNLVDVVTGNNLDGLVNSALIQKGDLRLGVISVLNPSVVEEYRLSRIRIENSLNVVKNTAKQLREQKADLIVLFYPYAEEFIEQLYDEQLIDISLSADKDISLFGDPSTLRHDNDIFLDQAGEVAVIDLVINPEPTKSQRVSIEWESVFLKDIAPDAKVEKQVAGYSDRLDRLLGQKLGLLKTSLDTTRLGVRTKENAFGNFVVDSVRRYADADISLINGGVIRGGKQYAPNTVLTRRDIAIELPFRSRVVVIGVSGKQIWQAVENGLSTIEEVKGRFPHVSGMAVTYDSSQPSGSRVSSIDVDGQPIDLEKQYALATTDYQAQGGDGYSSLIAAQQYNRQHVVPLVSDIVINEILVSGSIAPKVENRLTDISSRE